MAKKQKKSYHYYLIRLRDGGLHWAYVKSASGCMIAARKAKKRFGDKLVAFEPAPVKPKPGRDIYDLDDTTS